MGRLARERHLRGRRIVLRGRPLQRWGSRACGRGIVLRGRLTHLRIGQVRQTHRRSLCLLPKLQAEIPDPLTENLPELLSPRRPRHPSVWILLSIFISQNGFKRSAMQIEIEHISGGERRERQSSEELLIDGSLFYLADRWTRGTGWVCGQQHAYYRSRWRKLDLCTIIEGATGPRFGVERILIGRTMQPLLDGRLLYQMIVFASHHHSRPISREKISQGSCIPIQTVETNDHLGKRKSKGGSIRRNHGSRTLEFAAVLTIARIAKRA